MKKNRFLAFGGKRFREKYFFIPKILACSNIPSPHPEILAPD